MRHWLLFFFSLLQWNTRSALLIFQELYNPCYKVPHVQLLFPPALMGFSWFTCTHQGWSYSFHYSWHWIPHTFSFRALVTKIKILSFNDHLLHRPQDQAQSVVDGVVPEDWKKGPQLSKWAGKRTHGTTSQSASPVSLERWWSGSLWRPSPSTWMIRKCSVYYLTSISLVPH